MAGSGFYPGLEVFFGGAPSPEVIVEQGGPVGRARVEVPVGIEGELSITARNEGTALSSGISFVVVGSGRRFLRGDFNMDGQVDISDAVSLLQHLYLGNAGTCLDAGDVNNNEVLDITDAIRILAFLFQQGQAPESPFPKPGFDPDGGAALGCEAGA